MTRGKEQVAIPYKYAPSEMKEIQKIRSHCAKVLSLPHSSVILVALLYV